MTVPEYIDKLNNRFKSGIATEHSYRSDLLGLIESLVPGITITNEPKRVACGAPDYIITKRNIPVGYIESKDVGADLHSKAYKEQFDRYRQSLDNLIITDYLTFKFFVNGSDTTSITIGEILGNKIHPIPDNLDRFTDLIKNFCEFTGQTIKSAQKLSKMMAAKAKLLANVIELALNPEKEVADVNELQNINLLSQYESFKQVLIHDITPRAFADIYSQTIAYGMFAARLNDPSLENFTRQEAAELIPRSNPFLRKLFQYIAGYDLDDRIVWIVDALADIFKATNVEQMLKDFGKQTHQTDPFIHFYETFLAEYDPKLRKSRGVWYTPEPVVNFIVRAVDDILKTEFGLPQGLADTSKIKIKVPGQEKKPGEKDVHKVQILDPAAGTGTFLAEVIKQIHHKFAGQQGAWSQYVDNHLIPRLHGFEILMASYTMAHLKLELLLKESGYIPAKEQRLKVYLTNSLEEHHPDTGTLFANWLSIEANEANHVKRDTPIMIIIGNPPYSGESQNKGNWIMKLMDDYKIEPGGKGRLKEKNPKWLNDDYVKFLRYGQYFIEKNKDGILAFITPHGFLENPTFRGMRWNLLNTFNLVYTIDLHGNSKRKEISPDGSPDENVFDIMQGVCISLFIKRSIRKEFGLAKQYHFDVYGKREYKYDFLYGHSIKSIPFKENNNTPPYFFYLEKNFDDIQKYESGFSVKELFGTQSMGITSGNDNEFIDFDIESLERRFDKCNIKQIEYRPFDRRYINYDGSKLARSRSNFMRHFDNYNIAINLVRRSRNNSFVSPYITRSIVDKCIVSTLDNANIFPLYLYPEVATFNADCLSSRRIPNLDGRIINKLSCELNLPYSSEKIKSHDSFAPIDILDYIYAVLHSKAYIAKFIDLLKIEFPRIPYLKDQSTFWTLVFLGSELRQVHFLESPIRSNFITTYPISGSSEVITLIYKSEKVWINSEQYFNGVPLVAWESYIGGYQPAQKWLKDRKGRVLSFDDIMHYQKIIGALIETDRIINEIDKIDFLT